MPKLNDIYEEYGCNKGELVVIMDGFNIYHDKMKDRYVDSLGGIFPMLCVQDNLDSLHYLKKDFPGAAPTYGLVSPNKEILHSSRSYNDFKAALDALNLKKQPELCGDSTDIHDGMQNTFCKRGVSILSVNSRKMKIAVSQNGMYRMTLYSLDGKLVNMIASRVLEKGDHVVQWKNGSVSNGTYLVHVEGTGIKESVKAVLLY